MSTARRRLMRDFKRLQQDPPTGCIAAPQKNDLFNWSAYIFGPNDTIWEGAILKLSLEFTEQYPSHAPKVLFLTNVYHPNVYTGGKICIDILDTKWTSIYDVSAILTSLQSLLTDPNPDSPANPACSSVFVENRELYNQKVRECVEQSLRDYCLFDDNLDENVQIDDCDDEDAGGL